MNGMLLGKWSRRLLIALALGSFTAIVFGLIYGKKLVHPTPSGIDSYGRGAVDHEGFLELMATLGFHTQRWRMRHFEDATAPMWFIEPSLVSSFGGDEIDLATAVSNRSNHGRASVIVLPKWRLFEEEGEQIAEPLSNYELSEVLAAVDSYLYLTNRTDFSENFTTETASGTLGSFQVEVPWLQTLQVPSDYEVLLGVGYEGIVVRRPDDVIVISDPDILHNYNFHRGDHAAILDAIARQALETDTIVVDEVFHGHGQELSLASALGEFPTILIVIQAFVLLLMLVLAGLTRFGAPRNVSHEFHRGPREMIAVAASVLAAGQRVSRLATNYVEYVLRDLATRLFSEAIHHGAQHASRIDRIALRRGIAPAAESLVREAHALEAATGNRAREAITLARKAYLFRHQMLHQRVPWGPAKSQEGSST